MASKTITAVTTISKVSGKRFSGASAVVIIYGEELGRKYDLSEGKTVIGRSSRCRIQIDHVSVSRQHVRLTVESGRCSLEDLGSTNGTFVNDEQTVGKVSLRNADLIKVGSTVLKFIANDNIEAAYHDEIYRLTTIDGLTQVNNRRSFNEAFERELSRCRRYRRAMSLTLIDIDHFKKINDTYGHLAGDAVLKEVAATIKRRIRREDLLARYGGEEFVVLAPELELKGMMQLAEKVRRLVEGHEYRFDGKTIPVTVSCGTATLGKDEADGQALIARADERLYEAKSGGRNQVR